MRPAEIWQSPARPPYPPRTNHKLATRPATCPSTAHAPAVSLIHRRRRDVSVVKATAALFLVACLRLQNQIRITSRLRPSTADSRVISAPESIPTIAPYLLTHLYLHTRRRATAALEHQLIDKNAVRSQVKQPEVDRSVPAQFGLHVGIVFKEKLTISFGFICSQKTLRKNSNDNDTWVGGLERLSQLAYNEVDNTDKKYNKNLFSFWQWH